MVNPPPRRPGKLRPPSHNLQWSDNDFDLRVFNPSTMNQLPHRHDTEICEFQFHGKIRFGLVGIVEMQIHPRLA
jgi:hypothetical protein